MVVKITIKDNRFVLVESRTENLIKISKTFIYQDMSNCFVGGRFKKENIKNVCFLTTSPKTPTSALLPIGFLYELEQYLIHEEAQYKIYDQRKSDTWNYTYDEIQKSLGYLELYDYQVESVQKCLDLKSGVIKASTGAGKTEIFISLCKLTNKKTLILFARIALAQQTLTRMKKAGLDAGIVQGNKIDDKHQIVMATVQSGHKLNKLEDYEMVIIDECHRASGDQYRELMRKSRARYRFGFSATPFVKDQYKAALVRMWIGPLIYEVDPKKLLQEKRIATPTIRMIPISDPQNISQCKWPRIEKVGIVENSYRNRIVVNLAKMLKGQTLILVKLLDHGDYLSENIPNSVWLSGKNKDKERDDIIKRFDAGEDFVLIASTIFDEGIDIKTVKHVILCGGGASYVKILQRIGRGMRVTDTKTTVDVYDFYDTTNDILEKHAKERIKTYKKEGYDDIRMVDETLIKKLGKLQ